MAEICSFPHDSDPHEVLRRDTREPFFCEVCQVQSKGCVEYYHCSTCNKGCHIGCYKFPLVIKQHPYHDSSSHHDHDSSSHHLHLKNTSSNSKSSIANSSSNDKEITSPLVGNIGGCKCCQKKLEDKYYYCDTCKFCLNATCAIDPPPPTLVSPKIHAEETFILFPRHISLPCDACGLSLNDESDHAYACLSRNYIAHGKCIKELPSEIWITRHPDHRISYTHSLFNPDLPQTPLDLLCGVCYKTVNVNYGQYSCIKDCHYAVHSKCATRNDVWDGEELKGLPEESEEDLVSFENIDNGIRHFSHKHDLKFYGEKNHLQDGTKFCQACLLVIIDSDRFFSCMQCDFILHEACAYLPRIKGHQLHKHRLKLLPVPTNLYLIQFMVFVEHMFKCSGCHQRGYGFMYQCIKKGCKFQIDVRCASLPQSFIHGSHNHPLFLSLTNGECMRCESNQCSPFYLECTTSDCNFFLGLKCAMLPRFAHYRYDCHPLNLCYGEKDTSGEYWCEICETTLDASKWFYTCDKCKVTTHVGCLLGKEIYMKPNHLIKINDNEVDIVRNKGNNRPFCSECGHRCVDTLVFKRSYTSVDTEYLFCTLHCVKKSLDRVTGRNKKKIIKERKKEP